MKALTLFGFLALTAGFAAQAHAEARKFREVAVVIDDVKFWLPSTIVVHRGDHVTIEALSKAGPGSVHGFEIPEFGVKEVIDTKGKTFEFTASKAGIFPFDCQLHAAHVGGEVVVLK